MVIFICDSFDGRSNKNYIKTGEYKNKMTEREVHIWMDKIGFDEFENTAYLCTTYAETRVMIDAEQEVIHTTQPHFCQFEFGRIFVHTNGEVHEITIGDYDGTNREICEGYNLEQMLFSGEFSWFLEERNKYE